MEETKGKYRITLKDLKLIIESLPENTIASIKFISEDENDKEEGK